MPVELMLDAGRSRAALVDLNRQLGGIDLGDLAVLADIPQSVVPGSRQRAIAASTAPLADPSPGADLSASNAPVQAASRPVRRHFRESSQLAQRMQERRLAARNEVATSKLRRTERGKVQKRSGEL